MGFFAVLAASLFAVFIFTVFGGYSLLLWCQQSLWMVVPPALVLAVLVWTFLKMDDKITALQKRVDELEAAQKSTEKLFRQGRRIFTPYFLSCGSSSPSNITMPRPTKPAPSAKPTVPIDTLNKTPMATPNRMPAILLFFILLLCLSVPCNGQPPREGIQRQHRCQHDHSHQRRAMGG